jgi:hypothetical protein
MNIGKKFDNAKEPRGHGILLMLSGKNLTPWLVRLSRGNAESEVPVVSPDKRDCAALSKQGDR